MNPLYRFVLLACFLLISLPAHAGDNIAVIELFTAGPACDDVPATSKNFEKFAAVDQKNLIALTCYTTMFNKGNEESPLPREFCSDRLEEYQENMQLYEMQTPQVLINGHYRTLGKYENVLRDGIALAHAEDSITPIPLDIKENILHITLPKMRVDDKIVVWVMAYKKSESQPFSSVADGLEHSEAIHYVNLVQNLQKMLVWNGEYMNTSLHLDDPQADGYAVLAQERSSQIIVAAGKIEN